MSFRASNIIPAEQYAKAKNLALQVKTMGENRSASFSNGATAAEVLAVADNLREMLSRLTQISATPGISEYAKSQEDDPNYDVGAEFTAMTDAIRSVVDEIVTTIPKDADGWLLVNKINVDGSLSPRSFTGTQLKSLRTKLDTLADSVT